MNEDLELLASAYLDGDVTPDERAQVEASPELGAAVEQLRQVRAVLATDEPAAISIRERHLAGALDAWDRLPDHERIASVRDLTPRRGATPRPTSLASRRQLRSRSWVMAAAAGLIVVLGGGIVLTSLNTGSGDDSASEPPLGAATATTTAADQLSVADELPLDLADEARDEVAADAALPAADAVESEPAGGAEAPPPEEDVVNLTSLDDLAAFAASARNATTSQVDAPTTDAPAATVAPSDDGSDAGGFDVVQCPGIDTVVGPARYNGVLVIVGIDESSNEAVANRVDDCREIARALLP